MLRANENRSSTNLRENYEVNNDTPKLRNILQALHQAKSCNTQEPVSSTGNENPQN